MLRSLPIMVSHRLVTLKSSFDRSEHIRNTPGENTYTHSFLPLFEQKLKNTTLYKPTNSRLCTLQFLSFLNLFIFGFVGFKLAAAALTQAYYEGLHCGVSHALLGVITFL